MIICGLFLFSLSHCRIIAQVEHATGPVHGLNLNLIILFHSWHVHRERESASFHLSRVQPNFAFVRVAQVLANYQTQTHTLVVHLLHIFQFSKFLEKSFLICFAYADTRVLYFDQDLAFFLYVGSIDLDKTIFARKLECILNQIDQNLLKAHLVAENHIWDRLVDGVDQFFALNVSVAFKHQIRLMHYLVERELCLLKVEESLVNPS